MHAVFALDRDNISFMSALETLRGMRAAIHVHCIHINCQNSPDFMPVDDAIMFYFILSDN